jgi:hypothetical protein
LDAVLHANEVLIDEALQMSGAGMFLDASKSLSHTFLLNASSEIDASIIWLVRDGRGQVYSIYKRRLRSNNRELDQREQLQLIRKLTRAWRSSVVQEARILENWKGRAMQVRYEDICRAPQRETRMIWDFLGLPDDIEWPDLQRQDQHIMGSGSVRTQFAGDIRVDQKWKDQLSDDQLAEFDRLAGDMNKKLGYTD